MSTAPSRARNRARMEEILSSAAKLFYSKGYHATTIEDVARDVGMLKGSLYYYIRSKEDLLYELLLDVLVKGEERVESAIAEGKTPEEKLRLALREQIVYIIENQVRVGLFLHEFDVVAGRRRNRIVDQMRQYQSIFVGIVQEGQRAGVFVDGDAFLLVDGILGACNWIYRWYPGTRRPSMDSVVNTFVPLLMNGITKR